MKTTKSASTVKNKNYKFQPHIADKVKDRMINILKRGGFCYRAPTFYVNIRNEQGIPTLNKDGNSDVLKMLFSIYANTETSFNEIVLMARLEGFIFSKSRLLKMFQCKVYCGYVLVPTHDNHPEEWIVGLHQPIIDEETFIKVNCKIEKERK